uniref:Uncharacterized protein n=1 Tax=Amphimedon queenslandica TaxID=400682 RepID=A0A1X7UVW2_AMPQE
RLKSAVNSPIWLILPFILQLKQQILVLPSEQLKISLSPSYTVYSPMNYKKNTTNSQETSMGRHVTTTTTNKFPHIDESSHAWPNSSSRDISIEYSEGVIEGPWPAMYDIASTEHASPTTTRDIKMAQVYSSDYVVQES